jgi:transposase
MYKNSVKGKDFTGQNIYVGIDIHSKSWMVSIYSDEFELKTFNQEPDVDRLELYLRKQYPNANYSLAYEAGFCGFWIQRSFTQRGMKCDVIHPADIPSSDKEIIRKSDKIDSRKLARGLKNNELNRIYVPDEELESDRQMVRSRNKLVRDRTVLKNRIKAFLKFNGIALQQTTKTVRWTQSYINSLRQLRLENLSNKTVFNTYLDELIFLIEKEKQIQQSINTLAESDRYKKNVKLLKSIPSIGTITAMTLMTELGHINRFKKPEQLFSYCGLTPNCHSSGENIRIKELTRRGNGIVKHILIECAWMAVRRDPALLLCYKQLLPRMHANKAIIKIARKLLSRIRYVLKEQKEYQIGVIE